MTRIPRFSPTFSGREALAALSALRTSDEHTQVTQFERAFAEYIGVRHALMVGSARMATYLIMKGWDLKPGDEVLVPGLTYFAIPSILITMGLVPVFVDIDPSTWLMDPNDLERKRTQRTRAILPTHLYGLCCDMDPILKFAWTHGLRVLEDCAQATGARYHGKRLGSFGDATYYTFGLTKNITTLRGGLITTDDDALAQAVRAELEQVSPSELPPLLKEVLVGTAMWVATDPRVYPVSLHPLMQALWRVTGRDVIHEAFGEPEVLFASIPKSFSTSGPRGIQAAVGLTQLQRIDQLNSQRAAHGRFLLEHLSHAKGLSVPRIIPGAEPIFMSFPIQVANREAVARSLFQQGVDTSVGYMSCCATLPIYQGRARGTCPQAEHVVRETLHIPVHPNLTRAGLTHVVEAVRRAVRT